MPAAATSASTPPATQAAIIMTPLLLPPKPGLLPAVPPELLSAGPQSLHGCWLAGGARFEQSAAGSSLPDES